jgi:cysteine-rich repeat protein
MRETVGLLCLAVAISLRSSPCMAAPSDASLCGNGKLDPGEQCDDGNVKPLDGCSASCEVEQPTSCKNSTESAVRAVLGTDPEFTGMLTRAEHLGYMVTRFKRPLQCSEGNAPTAYLAMLRPKERHGKHALILYRTDMPQWTRAVVFYTTGDLDQYITVPLVTLHVDRRTDPPNIEVLDPNTGERIEAAASKPAPTAAEPTDHAATGFTSGVGASAFSVPAAMVRYIPGVQRAER